MKWIKCEKSNMPEDRIPFKKRLKVIVCREDNDHSVRTAFRTKDGKWVGEAAEVNPPEYWMPLPESKKYWED